VSPSQLADIILLVHFAYAGTVVAGFVLIPVGAVLDWAWVRWRWLRAGHLLMIGLVGVEGLIGMVCPLTQWEYDLRVAAGRGAPEGSFIGRLVSSLLYYDFEPWVFTTAYVVLTLLALGAWFWIPPASARQRAAR